MTDQTDTTLPSLDAGDAEASQPAARVPGVFQLEHDINIGGKVVLPAGTTIHVQKPMGGALRGSNLGGLVRMDYDQVALVAPRCTLPVLQSPMIAAMDPCDLMMLAGEFVDFLLPTAAKQALFPSE
ncbi:phage tail assembly protein [Sphingomonas sanguinis]|uniref:phage tail assembly protein n=1 Tax=Sphingomonas sanguinis TaxID=33051 RepID=UPI003015E144